MIAAAELLPVQSWLWELRPHIPSLRVWAWAHHSNLEPRQVEVAKLSTSSGLLRDKHKILSPTFKYTTGQWTGWKAWVKMCSEIEPPSNLLSTLTGWGGDYCLWTQGWFFWPSGLCRNSLLHVQSMLWPGLTLGLPDTLDYIGYLLLYLYKMSCIKSLWIMAFLGCSLHPLLVWQPKTCKSRITAVAHKQINNVFTIELPSMHNEVQLTHMHKCNSSENIFINKMYQACLMCSPVSAKVNISPWAAGL